MLTQEEIREIPMDCTIAYARIAVDHRFEKKDTDRVCIRVSNKLIDHPSKLTMQNANLMTTKVMRNDAIGTIDARHMCADDK